MKTQPQIIGSINHGVHQFSELDFADDSRVTQVSNLLTLSSSAFKASLGGHVPDWVVDNIIHKKYTSEESIRRTFYSSGKRFIATTECGKVSATVLIARKTNFAFVVDSNHINVDDPFSRYAPSDHLCLFNLAVDPEYRGKGLGAMLVKYAWEQCRKSNSRGVWIRSEPHMKNYFISNNWSLSLAHTIFFPDGTDGADHQDFNSCYLNFEELNHFGRTSVVRKLKYFCFSSTLHDGIFT